MVKTLPAICAVFWAQAALANQVTQVSARDGNVRIAADEPPNFTTFTIDYPPRLVVDVAGATLVDVPTNITVGQGGVQSIQTLPYGSGSSAVARIIIMYDKPVQTDILTDGNSIVVRQAEPPPAPAAAPVVAKAQPAPPKPAQQAAPPPPSPAPAPEPPAPRLAAAVPPSPRPAAPEPAVAPPPPAQPPRNAENAAPPQAPPAPPPQPPAAPPAPPPAETVAVAQNPPPAAEEPVAPPPESVVSPAAPEPVAPAPPAAAPTPSQPPAAVVARTEAPPPLKLNTESQLASPPPPPPSEEPPRVSARRKTLSLVGLRFNNGGTSVFVRTNEPVSYHVSERPNGLVITIENTRIRRRNDTRPLDAEYFDTPVAKVRASQKRGDVEVNIDLKAHAAYQATQSGREVELNFSKQG